MKERLIEFIGQIVHIVQVNKSDSNYKQTNVLLNSLFEQSHLAEDDSFLRSLHVLNEANQLSNSRILQIKNHPRPLDFAQACVEISTNQTFTTNEDDYTALAQCADPITPLIDLSSHNGINLPKICNAIIEHPSPQELANTLISLDKNLVTLVDGSDEEDVLFNSKNPQVLAESYVLLKKLGLDPVSHRQVISLPEEQSIETIKALTELKKHKITLSMVDFQTLINKQSNIKLITEVLIEIKSQSPDLLLNYNNVSMITNDQSLLWVC